MTSKVYTASKVAMYLFQETDRFPRKLMQLTTVISAFMKPYAHPFLHLS